jgi:hypothetical protein
MGGRRQMDLAEHVEEAGGGGPVRAEANGRPVADELWEAAAGERAVGALHARARAVDRRHASSLNQLLLALGEPRHVGRHEAPIEDAERLEPLDRPGAEAQPVCLDVLAVDVRVRDHADVMPLGQLHRARAQLVRSRGHLDRARPGADAAIRGLVEAGDELLGMLEVLAGDLVRPAQVLGELVVDVRHGPGENRADAGRLNPTHGGFLESLVGAAVEERRGARLKHLQARELRAQVVVVGVQPLRGDIELLLDPGGEREVVHEPAGEGAEEVHVRVDEPGHHDVLVRVDDLARLVAAG